MIVLAAGAMSDNTGAAASPNIRSEQFTKLKTQLQYELINLTQIFRNSVSISRVAPAGQCLQYDATESDKEANHWCWRLLHCCREQTKCLYLQ